MPENTEPQPVDDEPFFFVPKSDPTLHSQWGGVYRSSPAWYHLPDIPAITIHTEVIP